MPQPRDRQIDKVDPSFTIATPARVPTHRFAITARTAHIVAERVREVASTRAQREGRAVEDALREIAKFIARVLRGEDPASVRRDVVDFRRGFVEVKYGFKASREVIEEVFASLNLLA